MPLARIGPHLIYFAHIPKAGGSSVVAYLRAKGQVSLITYSTLGGLHTPPQHMERDLYDQVMPPAFYDHGFTVLRDPVDRLVSEFRYRAKPPRGVFGARRKGVAQIRLRGRNRNFGFDDWVRAVFQEYARDPYVHSNHIRPQAAFVHPDHRVFLFEDGLQPVFDWIDAVTDTPLADPDRHEKAADWPKPEVSAATRARIEAFYAEDYRLIDAVRAGR